jgi:enoyl-CoA hydratase/carnithine racemase
MDLVRYESANRVATITMDRSAKHNALNNPLCDALRQAWLRFRDSEDRVAVLAAAEEAYFSVGADVGDLPVNMWHAVPGLGVGRRPGFPRQAQAGVQGEVALRRVCDFSVIASHRVARTRAR